MADIDDAVAKRHSHTNMAVLNLLTVTGGKRERAAESVSYLYQGIAQRGFKLSFRLADHIEVKAATLSHGLLNIDLVRVVPEEAKPKRIPIGGDKPALQG